MTHLLNKPAAAAAAVETTAANHVESEVRNSLICMDGSAIAD